MDEWILPELGFNQVITWEGRGERKRGRLPGSDSNDGLQNVIWGKRKVVT